ncbi:MAG: hypothetical protein J6X62_02855 [Bacteroidales bacterium]|nr:hypothetical protein [Bacteroidales bacterium]
MEKKFSKLSSMMERVKQYGMAMPTIERDLLLQEIRELYEAVLSAVQEPSQAAATEAVADEPEVREVPEEVATVQAETVSVEPEPAKEPEVVVAAVAAAAAVAEPAVVAAQEESPFAPPEAEPDMASLQTKLPPVEELQGNDYGTLFDLQEPEPEPEPVVEEEPVAAPEPEIEFVPEPEPEPIPEPVAIEPEPVEVPEPEPVVIEPEPDIAPEPEPVIVEPVAMSEPEPQPVQEPVHTIADQPQADTLWDKLQQSQQQPSIADSIHQGPTLSDILSEQGSHEGAAHEATPVEPMPKVEVPQAAEPVQTETPGPVVEAKPAEPAPSAKTEPSLVDYLRHGDMPEQPTVRTIGDALGEEKEELLDKKMNGKRITDLRQAININDKFSFMNELFHSNMKAYNKFILDLNDIEDRTLAMGYVSSVAEQYHWDMESLAVKTFYSILERKFL